MRKFIVGAIGMMVAASVSAQSIQFVGDSAVYRADDDTWYNASANWSGNNFDGFDFGVVGSLTLGGEVLTWEQLAPNTVVEMGYEIFANQVTGLGANFVGLPFLEVSGNNDKWQNLTGVDIAAGLPVGVHDVAVWFRGTSDNNVDPVFDSNGGANFRATFEIVPEPSTAALLGIGLGGLLIAVRRRRA